MYPSDSEQGKQKAKQKEVAGQLATATKQKAELMRIQSSIATVKDSIAKDAEWMEWAAGSKSEDSFVKACQKYESTRGRDPFYNEWLAQPQNTLKLKYGAEKMADMISVKAAKLVAASLMVDTEITSLLKMHQAHLEKKNGVKAAEPPKKKAKKKDI